MKKIMYLLLALLLLSGCRSKKSSRTEHREEQKSERKEVKDSSTHVEKTQKVSTFDLQQSQTYEITLESDKDSLGNAKELFYNHVRDGTNETIIVRGGIVKLKANSVIEKDLIQVNNEEKEAVTTNNNYSYKSQSEMQQNTKQKEVKRFNFILITIVLLLGIVVFIIWRFKLFRWFK